MVPRSFGRQIGSQSDCRTSCNSQERPVALILLTNLGLYLEKRYSVLLSITAVLNNHEHDQHLVAKWGSPGMMHFILFF